MYLCPDTDMQRDTKHVNDNMRFIGGQLCANLSKEMIFGLDFIFCLGKSKKPYPIVKFENNS